MAYKISYGPEKQFKRPTQAKKHKLLLWILVVILLLGFYASGLRDTVAHWILPGDPDVTAAALQSMVDKIETGQGIGEAFTCFCQEIIGNADIPE